MKKKFDVDKWFDPSKELKKAYEIYNFFILELKLDKDVSKKCALKVVEEMLDFRNNLYINEGSLAHQYLIEVKHEIEKL